MSETTANPATAVLDRYVDFWNAPTTDQQREVSRTVFAEPVEYHAPVGVLVGAAALMDFRNEFIGHMGAATLVTRRPPETHHDRARLLWEIELADGTPFAAGTDVITLTDDGKISSVTSFLDRAPEGFDAHHHDHG